MKLSGNAALTHALTAVHLGRLLDGDEGARRAAEALARTNPDSSAAALCLGLLVVDDVVVASQVGQVLRRAEVVRADSDLVASHRAVWVAAHEDVRLGYSMLNAIEGPPFPDRFAAVVVIAQIAGDGVLTAEGRAQLEERFPLTFADWGEPGL
ncbi:MAG: hypothetical protein HN348_33720 [Proteobacteria bacterium]|nr:hypothetical protein [Pseudomonadota bacterium]